MGRKSEKKEGDAVVLKKKRRKAESAEPEPLMLAVQRCPPASRLSFDWVVGNGIGTNPPNLRLRALLSNFSAS